jgi:TetR/AcrR family transcriptional regulator, transcriptional repressor for nem operon
MLTVKFDAGVKYTRRRESMVGVRQFDEDAVINAALEVFLQKGLREATMKDLAEAANVRRGSLYNAYGDKEAVFLLAYDRYAAAVVRAAEMALGATDGREAVTGFFETLIGRMTASAPNGGCLTTRTVLDAAIFSERVSERVRGLLDALESRVTAMFQREEVRSQLALSPVHAALIVVTFTRGLTVMERAYPDQVRLRDSAAAIVSTLFQGRKED